MYKYDLSVILVTYNSNWRKIVATLNSILNQVNINFEIIICDDGSSVNPLDQIENYILNRRFKDFKLVVHEKNVGTVKNFYDGIEKAEGEFCYGISPGDMIYDDQTLADFYKFAKRNKSVICFGDTVFYSLEPEPHILEGIMSNPQEPKLFNDKHMDSQLIALFFNSWINGASYFRKTDVIKQLLFKELDFLKYVEDTPSSLLAIVEGYSIDYYERKIVFYEQGTGISSGSNDKWTEIIKQEMIATYDYLKKRYPNNSVIDAAWHTINSSKLRGFLYRLLYHPIVLARSLNNKRKKVFVKSTEEDNRRLHYLMREIMINGTNGK